MKYTLIHTALLSEAQSIIETYKLELVQKNPKIYTNNTIVLVVSNMGKDNTTNTLKIVFDKYEITKAINVGIAGSGSKSYEIGSLFCTNKKLDGINSMTLKTVDEVQTTTDEKEMLYDMEAKYFEEICLKNVDNKNIYIFKIISDYLDDTIPSKEFVKQLIKKNMKSLEKWI